VPSGGGRLHPLEGHSVDTHRGTPSYEDTIAWLQRLEVTSGWDLKLERMRAALALRGHPEEAFPAVHLAGTNGKGSTAAMVEAVLRASGIRTGLYTSPHLVDFAERIRAGGGTIPRDTVVALVAELRAALEPRGVALTHFEFSTLLALEWFARIGVEMAVVEVGLGGRLDATNTVRPIATAITSIAHDHEEWLGRELRQIAFEKAGIAKPGVPLVIGRVPPEAEAVIAAHAAEVGAPLVRAGPDGTLEKSANGLAFCPAGGAAQDGLGLALEGAFQLGNAEVALLLLSRLGTRFALSASAVRAGLAGARWPGRLAVLREAPLVVVDGAHNPAGVAALAAELPRLVGARRLVLVFAVMADKAWPAMLEHLLPSASEVIVTRVGRRGLDPGGLAAAMSGGVPVHAVVDPRAAVQLALERAASGDAVLVTGSLFLAGEAYATLAPGARLFEPWYGWGE
jgi:dihydrofolate synthase / folylpolyglutamate synthase